MKKCFTLAEVLITIGIIGIVSAMTIPTMINNYQKKRTVTELKKTYADLKQAYLLSVAQGDSGVNWFNQKNLDTNTYFKRYWQPYLKGAEICSTAVNCGYKSNKPWKYRNNTDFQQWNIVTASRSGAKRLLFRYKDKIIFYPLQSGSSVANYYFVVDINGSNGPNLFGKDVFTFNVLDTEGIVPYCHAHTDSYISSNCNVNGNGLCCAEKIKRDGWEITDDYPW